ncbi:hypothetical protein PLANTIT3_80012 [Plantibacter sp. T3]|nr:hypothetical protein PLANTIT3_80012 [Plantibacter sp. T3]
MRRHRDRGSGRHTTPPGHRRARPLAGRLRGGGRRAGRAASRGRLGDRDLPPSQPVLRVGCAVLARAFRARLPARAPSPARGRHGFRRSAGAAVGGGLGRTTPLLRLRLHDRVGQCGVDPGRGPWRVPGLRAPDHRDAAGARHPGPVRRGLRPGSRPHGLPRGGRGLRRRRLARGRRDGPGTASVARPHRHRTRRRGRGLVEQPSRQRDRRGHADRRPDRRPARRRPGAGGRARLTVAPEAHRVAGATRPGRIAPRDS